MNFNQHHSKRFLFISLLIAGVATATSLVLYALKQNINLFYTPTEVVQQIAPLHQTIRLGGMVKKGSIQKDSSLNVHFVVTDFGEEVRVKYQGILPDLFREGQGVVMLGQIMNLGYFQANEVLAKHDENYMPPEVQAALDKSKLESTVQ